MDLAKLKEILKVVAESEVAEVEIEEGGLKIVVRRNAPTVTLQPTAPFPPYGIGYMPMPYPPPPPMPAQAPPAGSSQPPPPPLPTPSPNAAEVPAAAPEAARASDSKPSENHTITVRAPIVGTFFRASSPEAAPFVEVGDTVKPGDVLCIIEAMKLMNEIEAEVAGTIRQILVENAMAVEYDQPLFVIETA